MTWDESKHPRVPGGKVNGGQFTDKELDTAVDAATDAAGVGFSEEQIINNAKYMLDLEFERLLMFDPVTGKQVPFVAEGDPEISQNAMEGDAESVGVSSWFAKSMIGKITMHNHPAGIPVFSYMDLQTAKKADEPRTYLVAGDWLVVAHRPAGGWKNLNKEDRFRLDLRTYVELLKDNDMDTIERKSNTPIKLSESSVKGLTWSYSLIGIDVEYKRLR